MITDPLRPATYEVFTRRRIRLCPPSFSRCSAIELRTQPPDRIRTCNPLLLLTDVLRPASIVKLDGHSNPSESTVQQICQKILISAVLPGQGSP